MPRITIDRRQVEVPPGATVLDAARSLGIDVPTLCHREGCEPSTSCLVCMVKLVGPGKLVPACGTAAVDGMVVESETDEVRTVRRSALELLLSDHLGDCLAPCQFACPAEMDIPRMLRQIAAGAWRGAIETVKNDIALPAVLGRICPAPCEKVCRRGPAGGAVAICRLKRLVADVDLASDAPYAPPCGPPSGKRVAVVGAGPTGLAAACYLARAGHAATILDAAHEPGGRLRREPSEQELPRDVLDAEIATILKLGVELRPDTRIDSAAALDRLRDEFDAVLLASGAAGAELADAIELPRAQRGIQADLRTFETARPGVFAAGLAVRGKAMVVRSVADGKEAAASIHQFLAGQAVVGQPSPFSTKIGRVDDEELQRFLEGSSPEPRREPAAGLAAGYAEEEGRRQAARCLHCDCRKKDSCLLRLRSAEYEADPRRYRTERRRFVQDAQHAEVIYEPGKCIDCGLCVQIARRRGEPLGLAYIGRGFDVRIGAPLGAALRDALQKAAAECVEACPTAALAWRRDEANVTPDRGCAAPGRSSPDRPATPRPSS